MAFPWAGSKGRLARPIVDKFPTSINNYYEPFIGSGAVLQEVLRRTKEGSLSIRGRITAFDGDEDVVLCHHQLKNHTKEVVGVVASLEGKLKEKTEICKFFCFFFALTFFDSFITTPPQTHWQVKKRRCSKKYNIRPANQKTRYSNLVCFFLLCIIVFLWVF